MSPRQDAGEVTGESLLKNNQVFVCQSPPPVRSCLDQVANNHGENARLEKIGVRGLIASRQRFRLRQYPPPRRMEFSPAPFTPIIRPSTGAYSIPEKPGKGEDFTRHWERTGRESPAYPSKRVGSIVLTSHKKSDPHRHGVREISNPSLKLSRSPAPYNLAQQPDLTILFGSRARGDHCEPSSDIDVMLIQDQEPKNHSKGLATQRAECAALQFSQGRRDTWKTAPSAITLGCWSTHEPKGCTRHSRVH